MNIRSTTHGRLASLSRLGSNLAAELSSAQQVAATGIKVAKASDAPHLTRLLVRSRAQRETQTTWKESGDAAVGYLDTADGALAGLSDVFAKAQELALQLGNDSYSAADRAAGAGEAKALFAQALSLANTEVGGRYIFAGNAYDKPAFDATGTYQGAAAAPTIQVSASESVQSGWNGKSILQGSTDAFGVLGALTTALSTNDGAGVRASLDELGKVLGNLSVGRSAVGVDTNTAIDATELAASTKIELDAQIAGLTEADPVEAYTRVNELQTAFESALAVIARLGDTNLFSRL